ncbi:MAG TPA: sulfite oxidase [Myxococcaceae bacterium]|nr:sulfite oxidase [Myxococcaceae bacterium]
MKRRDFLKVATGTAGALLLPGSASAGDYLLKYSGEPQQNLATPTSYFDRLITPNDVFFVRSHFGPPALDPKRKVRIEGARTSLELGVAELRRFPEVTVTAVLQCAGNGRALMNPRVPGVQWEHGAMGQAAWTGVRLKDVLEAVGVSPDAAWVHVLGADLPNKPTVPAFLRGIPVAKALEPDTLIAYRMNGEPLPLSHGAPFRLVLPGWSGNHWMKWLKVVKLEKEPPKGFFSEKGYRYPRAPGAPGAPVKPEDMLPVETFPVKSLIARPAERGVVTAGPQEVVGVAFSGLAPIARVEVSVDGGTRWEAAKLEGESGLGRWQVFRHRFEADRPGAWRAVARATDARGNTQPEQPVWNPSGYFWNAWHSVPFEVAG